MSDVQPARKNADAADSRRTATDKDTSAGRPSRARYSQSRARRITRAFVANRPAAFGLGFLCVIGVVAIFAPALAPKDPVAQVLLQRLQPPGSEFLLGTDELGRDVLSRLIYGARVSMLASFEAVGVAMAIGAPLGLLSGYVRGWFDDVCGRVADAVMSIPGILLAIAIVGALGPGITNAMVAIGIVYAPRFFRVVRGSTLTVREETFIEAARCLGCSTRRILGRHVLPNAAGPLAVETSLALGFALLAEAGLSFIGLGVQPPAASWGAMLGQATSYMSMAPTLVLLPGVLITLTVLAFNAVGDGFADAFGRIGRRS